MQMLGDQMTVHYEMSQFIMRRKTDVIVCSINQV